jgi:hypothetical protein
VPAATLIWGDIPPTLVPALVPADNNNELVTNQAISPTFVACTGPTVMCCPSCRLESGLGLIAGHAYSSPYEDLKLKGK